MLLSKLCLRRNRRHVFNNWRLISRQFRLQETRYTIMNSHHK